MLQVTVPGFVILCGGGGSWQLNSRQEVLQGLQAVLVDDDAAAVDAAGHGGGRRDRRWQRGLINKSF